MTWCVHGEISKKVFAACLDMINETFSHKISSIFHFDWVSDGQMAHVLGVKQIRGPFRQSNMHCRPDAPYARISTKASQEGIKCPKAEE